MADAKPGFLRRLFGLGGSRDRDDDDGGAGVALLAGETPEPVHLRAEEEKWLGALVADVGEGKRRELVGGREFGERIEALWNRGNERLAIEWLLKFVAAPETPASALPALRVRLVDMLERRGELLEAVPHLLELSRDEAHATRAHYLLGEHYRKRGDEVSALRHYEAVLARDVGYPNVRLRLERLRASRGRGAPGAAGETMAGVDVVAGAGARYHLVRELGRGATGVVYLARDTELERDVAVKLLHPHLAAADRADACALFFHEARVTASLRHPNIVAVLDLDEESRRIVMELAIGGTMRDVLRDRGPRPLRRALERHSQLLSALQAAHRRGIVHRDVKPANLMFRRDADMLGVEVMLGDFGVAHLPHAAGENLAASKRRAREAVGTLAYMSPEQRRGDDADPRDDLYAAAVVLYECLTGRHPWPRELLLAGVRGPGDFRLPVEIAAAGDPALIAGLQLHLDRLGSPDARARPDSNAALAEAQELRDHAVAIGATRE
jgi:hypothetical protein